MSIQKCARVTALKVLQSTAIGNDAGHVLQAQWANTRSVGICVRLVSRSANALGLRDICARCPRAAPWAIEWHRCGFHLSSVVSTDSPGFPLTLFPRGVEMVPVPLTDGFATSSMDSVRAAESRLIRFQAVRRADNG